MGRIFFLISFLLTVIQITGQQVKSFRTSDGETLYYSSKGKGPLVVFLYGGPGIGAAPMRPWADSLSNKYECIIYEQRGTGLSSNVRLDSSTINLKRAIQDIDELREHLGQKQLTLCGISWGGGLAQAYAAYYPENTKNIVLVCSMGPDLTLMSAFSDNIRMRRFPNEKDSLKYWYEQPKSDFVLLKRRTFSYIPDFYDHNIGYKMLPEFFAKATYHDEMGKLMDEDLTKYYNLNIKLKEYHGLSTIIKTRQDVIPEEMVYQIKNLLPQANIRTIERCGHFPDYEKPKELFKILREVL
jgi:proline iminopeptidase